MAYTTSTRVMCMFDGFRLNPQLSTFCIRVLNYKMQLKQMEGYHDGYVLVGLLIPAGFGPDDVLDIFASCGCVGVWLADWRLNISPKYDHEQGSYSRDWAAIVRDISKKSGIDD